MEAAADEERPLIPYLPSQDEECSLYTSDGTVDVNNQPALKRTTGNWRACFLILGTEFVECFVFFGVAKNLITYLTGELHESNVDAARNVSTWIGTCFFTPVIGAFLADTYWGRYWTLVIFLSIYTIGMLTLTVSASLPLLLDTLHNNGIRHFTVYLGLYLVALGEGGIKPCTSALGADQFDGADPVERVTKASFFNWYYFSINIGSLLSGTALVWVQDNVGWGVGFVTPTVLMVFGLVAFVAGRRVYRYKKLEGSPLKRVSQVLVAAVRNYSLGLPEDSSALHEVPSPTEPNCKIQHTPQFRFFDKAAIVATSSDEKGLAVFKNPWRLCTVSQVEELKMLLRMFPVWASMVMFFTVTAQMSSTFIEQGAMMDNRVGPFTVPPASLATFDVISVMVCIIVTENGVGGIDPRPGNVDPVPGSRGHFRSRLIKTSGEDRTPYLDPVPRPHRPGNFVTMVCIPVYDAVLVPLARRATGKDRGLSQLQRLGVGLALSVVAMVYAALVEARRLSLASSAAASQPSMISIMWQVPAFAVLGAGEVFTAIGILEFFYDQSPGGMKSLGTALAQLSVAAGNYLNSAVLGAVTALTARGGKPGWIPDNLNEGHLDYFFWLLAALGVVNLLHFLHCSMRYSGNNNNTAS